MKTGPQPLTERQSQLVDHAIAVVREHGLAGLTVRRLAEQVGFSEAALYRHFPSKPALLLALADRLGSSMMASFDAIASQRELPATERLVRILTLHLARLGEVEGLPILLFAQATASGDEELLDRLRSRLSGFFRLLARLAEEARPGPEAPSADAIAHVFFGLAAASAIRLRLFSEPELQREVLETLPRFLVERILGPADGD